MPSQRHDGTPQGGGGDARQEHPAPVEIRARGVSRTFGEREVLRDIDLEVRAGDIVTIVGGSGSGKTVLLDHLIGLLPAEKGRVLVADHDAPPAPDGPPLVDLAEIDEDHLDHIRLHWAVVFQHNALFGGTVHHNIALWLREHTEMSEGEIRRRVRQSLHAVALDPEDVLGKERSELSGGMAKRVAIARAIATEPLVIFYDEPTTGLDPVVSGHIHELVWNTHHLTLASPQGRGRGRGGRRPRHGDGAARNAGLGARTSVIVTHDRELLRRLRPRVVMLAEGGVAFDGSYDEFTRSDNPHAEMYLRAMPVLHARPTL